MASGHSLPRCCLTVLYCSAEPISPCFTFPAGETCYSVVLRSVCHKLCIEELCINTKYLAHTDFVLDLVFAFLEC